MPFKLGMPEIVIILVIILLVFGVGKLPQVGAAIGKSIRAFKEGQTGEEEEAEVKGKATTKRRKKQVKKPAQAEAKIAESKTEEKPAAPA